MARDLFVDDITDLAVREVDGVQLLVSQDEGLPQRSGEQKGRAGTVLTRREVERLYGALGEWLERVR